MMEHGQGTGETIIKDEGIQESGRAQMTTRLGQLLLFRDHLVLQFGFFCSPIKTNPHYSGLFVPSSVIITLSTFHIPTRQINIPWEGGRRVIEQSGMKDAETETQGECKSLNCSNLEEQSQCCTQRQQSWGTRPGWHLQEGSRGREQFPCLTGTGESPEHRLLYPNL